MSQHALSYSVWKVIVQADELAVYWLPVNADQDRGQAFAGTNAHVLQTQIAEDTWDDFNASFPEANRIEVGRPDDAIAQILFGLSDIPAPKLAVGGTPIFSPTYAQFEEDTNFKGVLVEAGAGETAIVDLEITTQVFMAGGYFWSADCNLGDYVEISVVDKNDVLGLFSAYGLTVGVDVLELGKFVETHYMKPGGTGFGELLTEDTAAVIPGLFVRTKYENVGTADAALGVTYRWFEV